jgi:KAP family P-loop domain
MTQYAVGLRIPAEGHPPRHGNMRARADRIIRRRGGSTVRSRARCALIGSRDHHGKKAGHRYDDGTPARYSLQQRAPKDWACDSIMLNSQTRCGAHEAHGAIRWRSLTARDVECDSGARSTRRPEALQSRKTANVPELLATPAGLAQGSALLGPSTRVDVLPPLGTVSAVSGDPARAVCVATDRSILWARSGPRAWRRILLSGSELLLGARAADGRKLWLATSGGELLYSRDGGSNWRWEQLATGPLVAIRFGQDGALELTRADGTAVRPSAAAAAVAGAIPAAVTLANVKADAPVLQAGMGWSIDESGRVLRGREELPHSRKYPPPWYYLAALVVVLLLVRALPEPAVGVVDSRTSIADIVGSDRPIERRDEDVLGLGGVADGVATFLRNSCTDPPSTLAITGEWGTGKSSMLNLLAAELREANHVAVSFNAWHHENEQEILNALFACIIEQSAPRGLGRLEYRVRLLARRWGARRLAMVAGFTLLLAFAMSYLGHHGAEAESLQHLLDAARKEQFGFLAAGSGVIGAAGLLFRLFRDLRSYGVDLGKVAASMAGSLRLGHRRAQVSFRTQFARDLADVLWALRPRRMVILVDDLDRCRPENAVQVLEAVNFLMSAPCFVVLATSRTVLEQHRGGGVRAAGPGACALR